MSLGNSSGGKKWLRTTAIVLATIVIVGGLSVGSYFLFFKKNLEPAPDFSVTNLQGQDFTLSNQTGKVVLIDFMSISCGPCLSMMPHLVAIDADYNDSEVVIISIDIDTISDTEAALLQYKNDVNATWQFAFDTDNMALRYSAYDIPKTVIVDKEGYVTFERTGLVSEATLRENIDATLVGTAGQVGSNILAQYSEFVLVFAFVSGIMSFFSPCAFPLMPGYIAFNLELLASEEERRKKKKAQDSEGDFDGEAPPSEKAEAELATTEADETATKVPVKRRLWKSFIWGISAAAGIALFYIIIGLLTAALGSLIEPWLKYFTPVMGVIFVALGIIMFTPLSLDVSSAMNALDRLSTRRKKKKKSKEENEELEEEEDIIFEQREPRPLPEPVKLFLYGVGYALASIGCNGPVLLAMISAALSSGGFLMAVLAFLIYSVAMGVLMVIVTMLVGLSKDALLSKMSASTKVFKILSGVILILVGGFLIGYFLWIYI